MGEEGRRKLTVVLVILLSVASGWMVAETEGRVCFRPRPTLKGVCSSDEDCIAVCDGFCSLGKCMCAVPC
ncbi:defensin-like protein 3 [Cucumis melo var. makuwa]|uniref:Defensin-like protein 3 n=1 Tax=Cucumis melo var. makuwa TaxID=1194695 RepID=A0A5D3BEY4_CUCMM|nr:defensin-like protein 3 [Cucumis melo var. makuwa]TYJ96758.1 defensin-like protein 3 [Cucumis melo var. makuwa]